MEQARWRSLTGATEALLRARDTAHWAAQAVAAVGASLVAPEEDMSHTSLVWSGEHEVLVGRAVDGRRAGLRLGDLTLVVLDADGVIAAHPLDGETLEGATRWLGDQVPRSGSAHLERPRHELPEHPVESGAAFVAGPPEALAALEGWYASAAAALAEVRAREPAASPVRCWPHHFDLATLVPLDDQRGERVRSIGAGMTPGDGSYAEPYFYVTPWPYPDGAPEAPLEAGGAWHTEGWVGAVLPASRLVSGAEAQEAQVRAFLASAFRACRAML